MDFHWSMVLTNITVTIAVLAFTFLFFYFVRSVTSSHKRTQNKFDDVVNKIAASVVKAVKATKNMFFKRGD